MSVTLSIGTVISDRYEIVSIIGHGGMSAIYLAKDRRLTVKNWAVKEMVVTYSNPEEKHDFEKLFTDEAHLLASLDHPNLPKVVDFFSEGDRKYLVMEYIEGVNLEDLVNNENDFLHIETVRDYAIQIADVLAYLHNNKPNPIIFRDLKPANIIITRDNRIKLIDFGIARLFVSGKTKDTIVLGTPGYAPPEQYGKSQTDERSDIFSFGATIYFMLTKEDPGKSPFHFPPPSNVNSKISKELEDIVMKAVNISPEGRFSAVREISEKLRKIQFGMETKIIESPVTKILPTNDDSPETKFQPQLLDFGILKRGNIRQMSFTISGKAKGNLQTDKKWLKTKPSKVNGLNTVIDAIVDTQSLKHGGKFLGNVLFTSKNEKFILPVQFSIQVQPLSLWNILFAVLLTIFSFIPILGFFGFIFILSYYYSCSYEERNVISIFLIISSIISIVYVLVILAGIAIYFSPNAKIF